MSTYFVDLDGTIFEFGTNYLLPGAKEFLKFIKDNNHQLILTTRRNDEEWASYETFSATNTLKALKDLNIEYHNIVFGVHSPRIIINDDGCLAINVETDSGIKETDYKEVSKEAEEQQKEREIALMEKLAQKHNFTVMVNEYQ